MLIAATVTGGGRDVKEGGADGPDTRAAGLDGRGAGRADEDTGYGVMLIDPRTGVVIGLHTNTGNDGRGGLRLGVGRESIVEPGLSQCDLVQPSLWRDVFGVRRQDVSQLIERHDL